MTDSRPKSEKVIMSADDIRRALTRIAHEIVEQNRGCEGLIFIGVLTRGEPIARRIAAEITKFEGVEIPVGALDIGPYRDDVASSDTPRALTAGDIPVDIGGKRVVLVDDVLYTGRSTRSAMDALIDLGRPQCLRLAVLVDRGHREMPIRADHVGKNLPTARDEQVKVRLKETDQTDEVIIYRNARSGPG
jgi:pyrimidine operon attenuation protein/uracil phosphoribosyltransferase